MIAAEVKFMRDLFCFKRLSIDKTKHSVWAHLFESPARVFYFPV